jgi:hypothetical protein
MTACVDNPKKASVSYMCECGHHRNQHGSQQHGQEAPGIPRFEHPCNAKNARGITCQCGNFTSRFEPIRDEIPDYIPDGSISDAEFNRLINEVE